MLNEIKLFLKKKLPFFLKKNRLEMFVFLGSLVLLLGFFLTMISLHNESYIMRSDSPGYLQIAKNLINEGVFSQSVEHPLIPDGVRTPLYPLFISLILILFKNVITVGVIQCILLSLGLVYVFKIGRFIGGNKVGLISSILFGTGFYHIVASGFIRTESLFVPIFLVFVYYFLLSLKKEKLSYLIVSGVLLGLSVLVRPVSLYLGIFLIFFLIGHFVWKKRLNLLSVKKILLFVLCFSFIISPWMIRNKIVFDEFSLTSIPAFNLYFFNMASLHADDLGVSKGEVSGILKGKVEEMYPDMRGEELGGFELSDYYMEESFRVLKGNEFRYFREHISGSMYFLVSNYYRKAAYAVLGGTDDDVPIYDIFQLFKEGSFFNGIKNIFLKGGFPIIMMGIGFALSFVYLLFLILNLFFVFRLKNFEYELFLYSLIGYFALITGPIGSGSYRYPVLPFIIILAIIGFLKLVDHIKKN